MKITPAYLSLLGEKTMVEGELWGAKARELFMRPLEYPDFVGPFEIGIQGVACGQSEVGADDPENTAPPPPSFKLH